MDSSENKNRQSKQKGSVASNLILVGMSGAGKSSVGKRLAQYIGFGFTDTDELIEKSKGKTVNQIFDSEGESSFRAIEKDVIQGLGAIRNHVISLGGGAVLDDDNWHLVNDLGCTVWIGCSTSEIARRLLVKRDELLKRPLYSDLEGTDDKSLRAEIEKRLDTILLQRKSRYEQAELALEQGMSSVEVEAQRLKLLLVEEKKISGVSKGR